MWELENPVWRLETTSFLHLQYINHWGKCSLPIRCEGILWESLSRESLMCATRGFLATLKIHLKFTSGPLLRNPRISGFSKPAQYSSVTQSCPTLCNPMDCSMPGFPVHHQLPELTQTHVHWVGDAIQPSPPLSSPSPPTFNLSQHQYLFQWVSSLHQVTKVLKFQLQHQSFQWILRTDFL